MKRLDQLENRRKALQAQIKEFATQKPEGEPQPKQLSRSQLDEKIVREVRAIATESKVYMA